MFVQAKQKIWLKESSEERYKLNEEETNEEDTGSRIRCFKGLCHF